MSFLSSAFGRKIRDLRLKRGLSQAEVAEKVNAQPATVSRWENGEFLPGEENLVLIGEFFSLKDEDVFPETPNVQELARRAAEMAAKEILKTTTHETLDPKKADLIALIDRLSPSQLRTISNTVRDLIDPSGLPALNDQKSPLVSKRRSLK